MTAAQAENVQVPFSSELRESTREAHERAENAPFVSGLLNGSVDLAGFAELAVQHYFIYSALESAAERLRGHPVASRFHFDGLSRVPALAADLRFLLGPEWASRARPNRATARYCRRVESVSQTWPGGYVAHHYTRYLGDVSGGQVVRSRLRAHHGLSRDGVRFYDFGALGSPAAFRREYRKLLDSAGWSAAERTRIVSEARLAFELNAAVFDELARFSPPSADAPPAD